MAMNEFIITVETVEVKIYNKKKTACRTTTWLPLTGATILHQLFFNISKMYIHVFSWNSLLLALSA